MKSFDAILMGAGVIGLSCALELRRRGLDVLLLDRGEPGQEASGAGAGMLAATEVEGPQALRELARMSAELYPDFVREAESESGLSVDFNRRGAICLGGDPGPGANPLSDAELAALEPALATSSLPASFVAEDFVEPRSLMATLVASAKQRGVHVHGGSEVVAVGEQAGRAVGVRTSRATFQAPVVVNCCGAWAGQLMFGPPTRPVKGHMLALLPARPHLIRHVIRHRKTDVYLVPRRDGHIAVGSTVEEVGFDKRVVPETIQRLHQLAADLVPELGEARIHEGWTGLRPGTPDKLPIMGMASIPGHYVATGHFRNGILLAPATAQVMADVITGARPKIELEPFRPSRFQPE